MCCGKDVSTPFCPYCGKANNNTLVGLLLHITGRARSTRAQYEYAMKNYPKKTRRCSLREKTAVKCESWRDQLKELLNRKS